MRYAHQVAWGRIVVVNGSREHAAQLTSDPLVHRVLVQAPPDQVAARLRQRGRDVSADVERRLARNLELAPFHADLEIHNDGPPEVAGAALRRYLEALFGPGEQLR